MVGSRAASRIIETAIAIHSKTLTLFVPQPPFYHNLLMGGASSVDTATGEAGKGSKGAAARDERAAAPAARAQADVVVGVAQEGDQAALARLEAEAFASKFSHVGLNRQQAIAVSAVGKLQSRRHAIENAARPLVL